MHVSDLHLLSPFCGNIRRIKAKNSCELICNFSRSCMNMMLKVCLKVEHWSQRDRLLVRRVIHEV